ncbi:hypothetical protein [Thalassotalea montiporae]
MTNKEYISMRDLIDRHTYVIDGRNAFVGTWLADKKCFVIARYKVGPKPRIHVEDHFDHEDKELGRMGTAKPIRVIEGIPEYIDELIFSVNGNTNNLTKDAENDIISYLEPLEADNPIEDGVNTLEDRK